MKACRLLVCAAFIFTACTQEADPPAAPEAKKQTQAPFADVPMPYRSVSGEGKHGLAIELIAPEAVPGGQRFDLVYEVSDDEGKVRGVLIE